MRTTEFRSMKMATIYHAHRSWHCLCTKSGSNDYPSRKPAQARQTTGKRSQSMRSPCLSPESDAGSSPVLARIAPRSSGLLQPPRRCVRLASTPRINVSRRDTLSIRLCHLPPLTPVCRAANIASVQIGAGANFRCMELPGARASRLVVFDTGDASTFISALSGSGYSPPRLTTTQLPSATELWPTPTGTCTLQMARPHGRTLIGVCAAPWACKTSQRPAFSPRAIIWFTACSRGSSRMTSAWARFTV